MRAAPVLAVAALAAARPEGLPDAAATGMTMVSGIMPGSDE